MSVQFSEMLDNSDSPVNSTQAKIIKLLDELKRPQSKSAKTPSQQINNQVKKFKTIMINKFQNINEKIQTTTSILSEVQRQANEMLNYKQMIKMKVQFQDNIKEIQTEVKQFYTKKQKQRKELEKYMLDRMLKIKLLNGEYDQRIKYQIEFDRGQFINKQVNRTKKTYSRQKDSIQLKKMQFSNKIKMLKRGIDEDSAKNKQEKKKIKKNFLEVCEKIAEQIQRQQKAIKQSFDMHGQTLQKLVISISERIQQ